jgi:hypothetical protein
MIRNRNKSFSARQQFEDWLKSSKNGAIYAKMDEIRCQFGADNSMNKACRTFLKLCRDELQVREDLGVLQSRRQLLGGAA